MAELSTQLNKRPEHQCKDIVLMLPLYAMEESGLTPDEMTAIKSHLAGCERCQREYGETQKRILFITRHRNELIRRGAFDTPMPGSHLWKVLGQQKIAVIIWVAIPVLTLAGYTGM